MAFTTLTKSLQLISPNLVASLRTLELVLAFLVQSILTGLSPPLTSSLGGALILLAVLLLASQDRIMLALRNLRLRTSRGEEGTRLLQGLADDIPHA